MAPTFILGLLVVVAILIAYPFWVRAMGMRLVHGWLQQNGYSANDGEVKISWVFWPPYATFSANSSSGEETDVILELGSHFGSFLGVAKVKSLNVRSNNHV